MIIEERLASSSPRRTRASSEPCWVKAGEEPAWEEQRPGACSMQHRLADWALTRAVMGGQMQAAETQAHGHKLHVSDVGHE